jgi:hypothetical protein
VLEVTSKTTQEQDEEDKPQKYQRLGVTEYFRYDPTGEYLQPQLKGLRLIEGHYQVIPQAWIAGSLSLYSEALGLELRLIDGELRFYCPETGEKLLSPAETAQTLQVTEQALQQEAQARRAAVPRLQELGLSNEQIAAALGLSVDEVKQIAE